MVTGLGLLELIKVFGEFFLGRKGRAVDALELFVLFIAAVVGTGDGEELEGFDLLGVADVRTGAEVDEIAVLVEADLLAFGDILEAPEFVAFLAEFLDFLNGFLAGAFDAGELLVLLDDLFHLGLDGFEVGGVELLVEIDIVVEALICGRADVQLGLRVEAQHRGSKDVGAGVAKLFERGHGFHGKNSVNACSKTGRAGRLVNSRTGRFVTAGRRGRPARLARRARR